jgi:hypothetical protein
MRGPRSFAVLRKMGSRLRGNDGGFWTGTSHTTLFWNKRANIYGTMFALKIDQNRCLWHYCRLN